MKGIKVFYIATITLLFSGSANFAQDVTWFPDNAEWYYSAWCIADPQCGFLRYYTAGDTMLAGKAAKIVNSQFESDESTASFAETHYFSVENDTVFYFSPFATWGMLYDFNAQPGDVWDLTEVLPDTIYPVWDDEVAALIEVDSVTTEMLGGTMRRVIYTSPLHNEEEMEPGSDWMFRGPIVEGVGPVGGSTGLFGESVVWAPGGWLPHFSCYREDGGLVYGSDEFPCGEVSSVADLEVQDMEIFPNPTANVVRIVLPPSFSFQADVTIYSVSGQVIARYQNFNAGEPLALPEASGMYLIECRSGERVARTRVVKN